MRVTYIIEQAFERPTTSPARTRMRTRGSLSRSKGPPGGHPLRTTHAPKVRQRGLQRPM